MKSDTVKILECMIGVPLSLEYVGAGNWKITGPRNRINDYILLNDYDHMFKTNEGDDDDECE